MSDDESDAAWADPAHPPVDDGTDLGDGVWVTWASEFNETVGDVVQPLIWHFCSAQLWIAEGREYAAPGWLPAGVKTHTLVSREPLHLEPSLLWSDCCGKHGFISDGKWIPA